MTTSSRKTSGKEVRFAKNLEEKKVMGVCWGEVEEREEQGRHVPESCRMSYLHF